MWSLVLLYGVPFKLNHENIDVSHLLQLWLGNKQQNHQELSTREPERWCARVHNVFESDHELSGTKHCNNSISSLQLLFSLVKLSNKDVQSDIGFNSESVDYVFPVQWKHWFCIQQAPAVSDHILFSLYLLYAVWLQYGHVPRTCSQWNRSQPEQ